MSLRNVSPKSAVVDPDHPWASKSPRSYLKALPKFRHSALTISVYPKAVLGKPEDSAVFNHLPRYNPIKKSNVIPMSLKFTLYAREIETAVHRMKIKNKIKTAISLIATKGASVDGENVTLDVDSKRKWILNGMLNLLNSISFNVSH